jgi:nucleotide-binding universal stress UspA family protein
MSNYAHNRILVGVDDGAEGRPLIDVAVGEARRMGVGLSIVHVLDQPMILGMQPWVLGYDTAVADSTLVLSALTDSVRADYPGLDIRGELLIGSPAYVLVEGSRQAKLIVLGCRGRGGFQELMLGSVSAQVAAHAHCPVLVVRPDARTVPSGPVLVGVDGSAAGGAAVEVGFAEAADRHVGLVVMHVFTPTALRSFAGEAPGRPDPEEAASRALVAEAVASWAGKYPDVAVEQRVVGNAFVEEVFVTASKEASLVVVGSRGRGGFAGLMLGSVSQALLHHGHCPVMVVRP